MATPVLTKALTALRAGFNTAFPDRDKTSDGWIGDAAHQLHVSGHNPDDTVGSLAEYSDADTIPEVRAIDVDADLRHPGVTMYDVIRRILATPEDLARLRYIIFCPPSGPLGANVPTIWSRNSGWRPVAYTGASPHNEHAHFSGDPNTDDDDRPWVVAQMGDDMLADERQWLKDLHYANFSNAGTGRGVGSQIDTEQKTAAALGQALVILGEVKAVLANLTTDVEALKTAQATTGTLHVSGDLTVS